MSEASKRPNVQTSKKSLSRDPKGSDPRATTLQRALNIINLSVFLVCVLVIAIVVNIFADRDELRSRIDATKTRAYSLSPQTRDMLRELEGEWTIAAIVIDEHIDRAVRRQIDEVLTRFRQASPNINVTRIDPTDPRTLVEFESLLAKLREIDGELVDQYDRKLDEAEEAFRDLIVFSQQQSGRLEQLLQLLDHQQPGVSELIERTRMIALIAEQGQDVLNEVTRARRITDGQPIPDYDIAQSILVQSLTTAANELFESAELFDTWMQEAGLTGEPRQFVRTIRDDLERQSRETARIVDPLMHLPPLELATIGRQLAEGEAAVIIGPEGAAAIPSAQLFPRSNIRQTDEGRVSYDQRFRGEQLIASTIRSLLVDQMPLVVFVHAAERSMFRPHERQADLVGMVDTLTASRFEVKEWGVGQTQRPTPEGGQPVVYVIVPPAQRTGLEPSESEVELIDTARRLIDEGEPILLSTYPSLLPRYGQVDPWANVARAIGLEVQTDAVVYESIRLGPDEREIQRGLAVDQFVLAHPISRAVHGQRTSINLPMGVHMHNDVEGVRHQLLLEVAPAPNRWLEPNWAEDPARLDEAIDEKRFDAPLPIIVTMERSHPVERGTQRAMVVGSGGWMLSYIADVAVPIGGERMALAHPGNYELMLASVAWLAGMDDLIAQSPTAQEVARLGEISDTAGRVWFVISVIGLPLMCLALGVIVWGVRRV